MAGLKLLQVRSGHGQEVGSQGGKVFMGVMEVRLHCVNSLLELIVVNGKGRNAIFCDN